MKKVMIASAVFAALWAPAVFAQATPDIGDGAGQPNENASPMGKERATRNSAGGDRDKGDFGPTQSDFVKDKSPYGQWLQDEGWTDK